MTERLVEGPVVAYSPQLAMLLGSLAAACVLQQIHFWMPMSTNQWGGHRWVYKTYEALGAEVGISKDQARKAVKDLREVGLIEAMRNPYRGFDQTLWFRAVYEEIEKFVGVAAISAEDRRPASSTDDVAHNADHLVPEAAALSSGPDELASQPPQYQERTTGEDQQEITRDVQDGSADVQAPGVGKEESAGPD